MKKIAYKLNIELVEYLKHYRGTLELVLIEKNKKRTFEFDIFEIQGEEIHFTIKENNAIFIQIKKGDKNSVTRQISALTGFEITFVGIFLDLMTKCAYDFPDPKEAFPLTSLILEEAYDLPKMTQTIVTSGVYEVVLNSDF